MPARSVFGQACCHCRGTSDAQSTIVFAARIQSGGAGAPLPLGAHPSAGGTAPAGRSRSCGAAAAAEDAEEKGARQGAGISGARMNGGWPKESIMLQLRATDFGGNFWEAELDQLALEQKQDDVGVEDEVADFINWVGDALSSSLVRAELRKVPSGALDLVAQRAKGEPLIRFSMLQVKPTEAASKQLQLVLDLLRSHEELRRIAASNLTSLRGQEERATSSGHVLPSGREEKNLSGTSGCHPDGISSSAAKNSLREVEPLACLGSLKEEGESGGQRGSQKRGAPIGTSSQPSSSRSLRPLPPHSRRVRRKGMGTTIDVDSED